ncbi:MULTISPECIES: hypothetical protein [unclassified Paenibacillus]|uniref:hypothetical protein n=1 Tax=unclassified Paenibacillus TaxID=185978 RepID=UPI0024053074|nr:MULTISPECIES: hypothetical protein [unclassified Paenibacillus]MDF9843717.1 hypothetical protein [Paenibacillus sp. PastF-2]MDF9851762.1 hypothetical protein [Paenibacillus sp. PastM-2]MDF9858368.1 hypothetical protein [Paenibacillus sp. PastF-1]MDH6483657.1 hypothetical protein [Paenibacillus sp. PastH-2]MDH6505051.1 hypothetical protein [Paenibacillus sp. PastM-3]
MANQRKLEEVLRDLSKEELIAIIAEAAGQDEVFKNTLLLKYGTEDQPRLLKTFQKLIKTIVKQYTGREGFIPYRETSSFAADLMALLESKSSVSDDTVKLEMALLVLEEGVEAFQYADDSDGEVGALVDEVLDQIDGLAESQRTADESVREHFLTRLITMSRNAVFDGWDDYPVTLLRICTVFADEKKRREQLLAAIGVQLAANSGKEYVEYSNEALQGIQFELIEKYSPAEEADKFIQEHLHLKSFRKLAIQKSMEAGDYQRAIQLAEQGERHKASYPGDRSDFKKARYEAYKALSLKEEQKLLAKELLLDGGYEYYAELEALSDGNKEDFYRSILAELKKSDTWSTHALYLQLISDKNDLAEMLSYVQANPNAIEEYAARLSSDYKAEVEQVYSQYIYDTAAAAFNRKKYWNVCQMLKRYGKLAGKSSQSAIIQQLQEQYFNKPAFLDELSKL